MRLVKVPPLSGLILNGNTLHAVLAWMDADIALPSANDTNRYHAHFFKEGYSLPDGTHYFFDIEVRFLELPSTLQDDFEAVLDAVCGEFRL